MNLIDMLQATVTPLSEYKPTGTLPVVSTPLKRLSSNRNTAAANKRSHEIAVMKYRAVMGTEWCSTRAIECRLGMGRSCCLSNLAKWVADGLLEQRIVGTLADWNRRKGYEWRFVK